MENSRNKQLISFKSHPMLSSVMKSRLFYFFLPWAWISPLFSQSMLCMLLANQLLSNHFDWHLRCHLITVVKLYLRYLNVFAKWESSDAKEIAKHKTWKGRLIQLLCGNTANRKIHHELCTGLVLCAIAGIHCGCGEGKTAVQSCLCHLDGKVTLTLEWLNSAAQKQVRNPKHGLHCNACGELCCSGIKILHIC